jgi:hypothetical protein
MLIRICTWKELILAKWREKIGGKIRATIA